MISITKPTHVDYSNMRDELAIDAYIAVSFTLSQQIVRAHFDKKYELMSNESVEQVYRKRFGYQYVPEDEAEEETGEC